MMWTKYDDVNTIWWCEQNMMMMMTMMLMLNTSAFWHRLSWMPSRQRISTRFSQMQPSWMLWNVLCRIRWQMISPCRSTYLGITYHGIVDSVIGAVKFYFCKNPGVWRPFKQNSKTLTDVRLSYSSRDTKWWCCKSQQTSININKHISLKLQTFEMDP